MKPCFGKQKLLAWMALGELDECRAQDLRSHVQACEGCRRYLEELSSVRKRLAAAETSPAIEPSPSFHRKWVGRLKAPQSPSPWRVLAERLSWRVALPVLGAAAMLVLLALSLVPKQPVHAVPARVSHAEPAEPAGGSAPPLSVANYQRVAVRSLDEFDDLLTRQAKRRSSHSLAYTASIFAAATSQN